ncbi:unnamed protein product [Arabis nemorensis]|uniref:Uncharacterized protein n=1 Tax=Arabis nemorensis TaxID=586526 RepID=A0A565BA49_9BRAS|nr:unnamed protein product [Arabis nemorensis]
MDSQQTTDSTQENLFLAMVRDSQQSIDSTQENLFSAMVRDSQQFKATVSSNQIGIWCWVGDAKSFKIDESACTKALSLNHQLKLCNQESKHFPRIDTVVINNKLRFRGEIARIVLDPVCASLISNLLQQASTEELEIVCLECKDEIHTIAPNLTGSKFLIKLFARLKELYLGCENMKILLVLTVKDKKLQSTICHQIGSETFFDLLCYIEFMNEEFVWILARSLTEIMIKHGVVDFLFTNLFERLTLLDLRASVIPAIKPWLQRTRELPCFE